MKPLSLEDRCEAWLAEPGRFDRIIRRADLTTKIAVVGLGLAFLAANIVHAL